VSETTDRAVDADRERAAGESTDPYTPTFDSGELPAVAEPLDELPPPPAQPVVVPGEYQFLKRWKFAVLVAVVWAFGAAAGCGMYYWWYHSLDKTAPVFVVLVFLIVTTVAGVLIAMAPQRPWTGGLALAVTSAPLAAVGGAAVLHGVYYCHWAERCLLGLIPY
jgi:hypothetical protein